MIDKITSRLSSQKPRPQSLNEDDEDSDKDEVEMIDEIMATSRRHPLTGLTPAPPGLSTLQVSLSLSLCVCVCVLIRLLTK